MENPGESDAPYPRRFWWLKRLTLLGAGLLVGLGGLRTWWGNRAEQLLAAEHAAMRAAGHPVTLEELDTKPIPDDRNAAAFMLKAIAIKDKRARGPHSSSGDFPEYPPFPPEWHKLAGEMVEGNGPVFPLLRQARAHDQFDWGVRVRSPAFQVLLEFLNPSRDLCNFLTDAALREHVNGNDAAAIELIRDARHVSRAVDSTPFLVSHLVATGCDALALHRLQVITAGITVKEGEDFPVGSEIPDGPATRGQLKALTEELLQPAPPGGRMGLALAGQRVFASDLIRSATGRNPILRPMFVLEERRVLAATHWYGQIAAGPTWADVQLALRARRAAMPAAPRGTRMATSFSAAVLPAVDGAMRQSVRVETSRRLAAVSLAVQLYRFDHDGAWPPSLDALVPAYLPAVPADPFEVSGAPLGYVVVKNALPFGGDRPIVYSVTDDGGDQTGAPSDILLPKPEFGWTHGEVDSRRDLVRWHRLPTWAFGIRRWLRSGPDPVPATTLPAAGEFSPHAVEDEPDESDDPGDSEHRQQP